MRILKEYPTPADHGTRPGAVILVKRDHPLHPYVTGWMGEGDNSWCWGHYFRDWTDAVADYHARCRRGY